MSWYASVAAVRIQSWIARTPDLKYVRGASISLTKATQRAALLQEITLPQGVAIDDTVGEVAGVVVLTSSTPDELDQAVELVLDHLQEQLPGVEWSAWRAQANSYVEAFAARKNNPTELHLGLREWPHRLPLTLDLPFATACARCAHELAVKQVHTPDSSHTEQKFEGIGPDCSRRHAVQFTSPFEDFEALAKRGKRQPTAGRRVSTNHLATVCADGNRVGTFFDLVAKLNDVGLQQRLSSALNTASTIAAQGAEKCGPHGEMVAITHFVGGDDIFASVAAPFAWRYVQTLASTFESRFRDEVAAALTSTQTDTASAEAIRKAAHNVTLGIGIAFAHAKHPLADTRDSAQAAEHTAKAAARGQFSAVSWLDLTVEPATSVGRGNASRGRCVSVSQLTEELASGTPPIELSASARQMLISLLRIDPDAPEPESADDITSRVKEWAGRVGTLDIVERLLPEKGSATGAKQLEQLRQTLDRTRWWPVTPDAQETGAQETDIQQTKAASA